MMTRILLVCAMLLTVGCGAAVRETIASKSEHIVIRVEAYGDQPICAADVGQVVRCKTVAQFREWIVQQ